eukprot:GILI01034517.1.p1 GENE.GILI01034517.1~~GILI01034517.1.p1  ORF type:complete len:164 (-),score=29.71 GILI01034517.1:110-571(-)
MSRSKPAPARNAEEVSQKIHEMEKFIDEKLKADLKNVLDDRDKLYEELSQYLQLRSEIEMIKDNKLSSMKTMTNLGSDFFVEAEIPDTSRIFVRIGFGFHVEFTLDEALAFIEQREKFLNQKAESLTQKSAEIKAHIKVFLEAIAELMNLPAT